MEKDRILNQSLTQSPSLFDAPVTKASCKIKIRSDTTQNVIITVSYHVVFNHSSRAVCWAVTHALVVSSAQVTVCKQKDIIVLFLVATDSI